MQEQDAGTKRTTDEVVFDYRLLRLLQMGFGEELAMTVALNKYADLHQIERAIDAGCSFDLAAEIFSA